MNGIDLKVYLWAKKFNLWRIAFIVVTSYFAIAGYTHGLLNSFVIAVFFWSLYQMGYQAALKDLVTKAEE